MVTFKDSPFYIFQETNKLKKAIELISTLERDMITDPEHSHLARPNRSPATSRFDIRKEAYLEKRRIVLKFEAKNEKLRKLEKTIVSILGTSAEVLDAIAKILENFAQRLRTRKV